MTKLNLKSVLPLIKIAIEEDLGTGDVTSQLVFEKNAVSKAYIVPREKIVVCGMDIVRKVLNLYSRKLLHRRPGRFALLRRRVD